MWNGWPLLASWLEAKIFCGALNLAGRSDWRLPTRIELLSILDLDFEHYYPAINSTAFRGTPGGQVDQHWDEGAFWTSSTSAADPSKAWQVVFTGLYRVGSFTQAKTGGQYVRCVRLRIPLIPATHSGNPATPPGDRGVGVHFP